MNRDDLNPASYDSRTVNLVAPALLVGLALAVNLSPLSFPMQGFHVWMHELGHATVAWLTGRRAVPLPFGWTSVGDERSVLVYGVVLALLVVLAVAGWRERKAGPVILALVLIGMQFALTWEAPAGVQRRWQIFGGVGGEFYLSALLMAAFFVPLPERFRWGACRYVVFFIAASCFIAVFGYWRRAHYGLEDIPWGSTINGEGDGGGDMNILRDEFHWSNHQIVGTYYGLGRGCLAALLVVYAACVLRINRLPALVRRRGRNQKPVE